MRTSLLLFLLLSTGLAYGAPAAKLVDYLVGSTGSDVVKLLERQGILGADAQEVKHYLESSLKALSRTKELSSKADLVKVLNDLPVTGDDVKMRAALYQLLDKPAKDIKKADVVSAINNIVKLARRHGTSVVITCANCANKNLAKIGFDFSVKEIKNGSVVEMLDTVIPKDPKGLNTFISTRMKALKMGDYSKVTPSLVAPEEEKSLAMFLELAKEGSGASADQRAFIEAVKKVSTNKNGVTNIIDPKNPHKFWKVLLETSADEGSSDGNRISLAQWAEILDEVSLRAKKDGVNAEEAFYRVMKDKPGANEELLSKLKKQRCFFR